RVISETDEGTQHLELPLPAVISTAERLIKPIKVKNFDSGSVAPEKIEKLHLEDLDLDPMDAGVLGSPTWVAGIREEKIERTPVVKDNLDSESAARMILEAILSASKRMQAPEIPSVTIRGEQEFWCLIERFQERTREVSLEILATAAALASQRGG